MTFGFISKMLLNKNGDANSKHIEQLLVVVEKQAALQSETTKQLTAMSFALESFAKDVAHQFELNRQAYSPDDFKVLVERVHDIHTKVMTKPPPSIA